LSRSTPYTSTTDLPSFRIEFPVMIWNNTMTELKVSGVYKFPKTLSQTPQNSRCQKHDTMKVLYWESTCVRHHHTKFCHLGYLAPEICSPPQGLLSAYCCTLFKPQAPYGLSSPDQNSCHYPRIHMNRMATQPENRVKYNEGVNFHTLQMWSINPWDCRSIPTQHEANLHAVTVKRENPASPCPLETISQFISHDLHAQYRVFKLWHCEHAVKASTPRLIVHFCRNYTAPYKSNSQDLNMVCYVFIRTYFVFVIFMLLFAINSNATN
jgi:hypothetical protein